MSSRSIYSIICVFFAAIISSCGTGDSHKGKSTDTLSEAQRHLTANALKGLDVVTGLGVQMMASEPAIRNPTNIDVDDKGRIWVTEAYNYRPESNGNPVDSAGDRIVILEDKDGDGIAETNKIFYQGPEINAPLGICVLGDRVLVSQSPYVWAFFDDNGDDKADRKEIIFQGISGVQHDHGMHSFVPGPDGKLYFNFGNEGKQLMDKNNKPVLDQDGDPIDRKKYKMGMAFRCDPDGSHVEVLGQNFRNNYELTVDSYGSVWQSDNDDDGNRGVRINYVMQYGNYGYADEMTGAYWSSYRINMEDSIPLQHWHLNDPGVVPNLLQTGGGSPTGIAVYEGQLLPEKFRNQIIHCDAGRNVVRSYPVSRSGAGYAASIDNILTGDRDQWFRPSDICVAPDGSLIVADWYDPGVGGHGAGDQVKGRIYRVAPDVTKYRMPSIDYSSPSAAITALQNPNKAIQYNAFSALQKLGRIAVPPLEQLWKSAPDDRMKARAFWVLVKMPGGDKYINEALQQKNSDLRITGLRAAKELNSDLIGAISKLADDEDPQVRRECAVLLHHNTSPQAPALWASLASRYDGKDRWYLEALGIGAEGQWDKFFAAYEKKINDPLQSNATRDIVWRARSDRSLHYLARIVSDETISWQARQKYFRAFDFNTGAEKSKLLIGLIAKNTLDNPEMNAMLLQLIDPAAAKSSPVAQKALKDVLAKVYGKREYLQLVSKYKLKEESPKLLQLAASKPGDDFSVEALSQYFQLQGEKSIDELPKKTDTATLAKLIPTLGNFGSTHALDLLQNIMYSKTFSSSIRQEAATHMGKSWDGESRVVQLLEAKQMPADLITYAVDGLKNGERADMYIRAKSMLPGAEKMKNENRNITVNEILSVSATASNGEKVFKQYCTVCHMAKNYGKDFGPKLNEIGDKLPKEAIFEAITNPSKSVSFGYETSEIVMNDGSTVTGIISNKTKDELELKLPGGIRQKVNRKDVKSVKTKEESMMPALHEAMSKQNLADLIAFLSQQKKSSAK